MTKGFWHTDSTPSRLEDDLPVEEEIVEEEIVEMEDPLLVAANIPEVEEPEPTTKKAVWIISWDINGGAMVDLCNFTNPHDMDFGCDGDDWVQNFDVYVSGLLMISGAGAWEDCDCYWYSTTALAFKNTITAGASIQIIQRR